MGPPYRDVPSQKGGLNSPWHRLGSTLSSRLTTCGSRWQPPPWVGTEGLYTAFPVAARAPAEASLPGRPSRLPMLRGPGFLGGETQLPVCPPYDPLCYLALPLGYHLPLSLFVGSFSSSLELSFIPPCFAGAWRAGS